MEGSEAITCRPADNIEPELGVLESEFDKIVSEKGIRVADEKIDDLMTYALFPQVGIKFLENRDNPDFFEPVPQAATESSTIKKMKESILFHLKDSLILLMFLQEEL